MVHELVPPPKLRPGLTTEPEEAEVVPSTVHGANSGPSIVVPDLVKFALPTEAAPGGMSAAAGDTPTMVIATISRTPRTKR